MLDEDILSCKMFHRKYGFQTKRNQDSNRIAHRPTHPPRVPPPPITSWPAAERYGRKETVVPMSTGLYPEEERSKLIVHPSTVHYYEETTYLHLV